MKSTAKDLIQINEIDMRDIEFHIVGESPLIMNRFSQKAWRQILLPPIRTNRAERSSTLKHNPIEEYRGAVYRNRDPKRPSLLHLPNGMFHKAIASAALDIPGATKSKIERLTKIPSMNIDLFGLPRLFCAMVRNSDMNHTPDVRSRPVFERWACKIVVRYVVGILTERTIANLLAAAGKIVGVGDWRGEKGGPYGAFRVAEEDDEEYAEIVKTMGRKAQEKAMAEPVCYDDDTEELLAWFNAEVTRRESTRLLGDAAPKSRKKKSNGEDAPPPSRRSNDDIADAIARSGDA